MSNALHPMDQANEQLEKLDAVLVEELTTDLREALDELTELNATLESAALDRIIAAIGKAADGIDGEVNKAYKLLEGLAGSMSEIEGMVDWDAIE